MMAFREESVTQAAMVLLAREKERTGSADLRMNYTKLLKLLYLAERRSLVEATKSISGDKLIEMKKGPLLSETYDLIKSSANGIRTGYWCERIKTEGYEVVAESFSTEDLEDLSDADERRLNEVYNELGHMDEEELIDWCHRNLPELTHLRASSRAIPTMDVFFGASLPDEVALKKERDLFELIQFERVLNI